MSSLPVAKELIYLHLHQPRNSGNGTLADHSRRVCQHTARYVDDAEVIIAACLHDILEDSTVSENNLISWGFSRYCVDLILGCSYDLHLTTKTEQNDSLYNKLKQCQERNVRIIKIADTIDNLYNPYPSINHPSRHKSVIKKMSFFLIYGSRVLGDHPIITDLETCILSQAEQIYSS